MLFQTLDDKKDCVAVFINDSLNSDVDLKQLKKTWAYNAFLKGQDIDYASLYVEGKNLSEACPEHLKEEWNNINIKLKAFLNSFIESKVSLKENCFFDLTPERFLIQYCQIKNKICQHIFDNVEKPKEYEFYRRFTEILNDIKYRELNIDINNIQNKLYKDNALAFYKKIANGNKNINYNLYGSITGRLTVKKDSFPILTFPKQYRSILKPVNDWFISFDMNAAELRTALALTGKEQPNGDFHQWTVENVYNNELSRAQAKETTTSWLYNSNSALSQKYNLELSNLFQKQDLKNKYWLNGYVHTPYNRIIQSDEHHAISYLNQSTFIDLFHRQIIKVDDYLQNKNSFIAFMIHDEFVLDVKEEEKNMLIDIINILQNTSYGVFPVNIKAGKDFSNMKKLNLKVE